MRVQKRWHCATRVTQIEKELLSSYVELQCRHMFFSRHKKGKSRKKESEITPDFPQVRRKSTIQRKNEEKSCCLEYEGKSRRRAKRKVKREYKKDGKKGSENNISIHILSKKIIL